MTDEYHEPAGYAVGENFVCLQHLDALRPTEREVAKVQYTSHPDGETCIVCTGSYPPPTSTPTPEEAESTVDDLLTIRMRSLDLAYQVMTTLVPRVTATVGTRTEELIQSAAKIESWLTR